MTVYSSALMRALPFSPTSSPDPWHRTHPAPSHPIPPADTCPCRPSSMHLPPGKVHSTSLRACASANGPIWYRVIIPNHRGKAGVTPAGGGGCGRGMRGCSPDSAAVLPMLVRGLPEAVRAVVHVGLAVAHAGSSQSESFPTP